MAENLAVNKCRTKFIDKKTLTI